MKSIINTLICIAPFALQAQVDVTKYASDNLFKVQPIVDVVSINQEKTEEKRISQWDLEIQKGLDLWETGDLDEAEDHFLQMEEEFSETPIFSYYLGLINYDREAYAEAIDYFNNSLKIDPLFLESKYMKGLVLLDQKELKEAKELFNQLVEVQDYSAYGTHGLALYFLEISNVYRAKSYLKKTIQTDPSFLQAYIPLIQINLYFGYLKESRQTIEAALETNPKWEQGIMIRGMISLLQDENFDQFEKDINYLTSLSPSNYHYISIKGYLQMEIGEYNKAVDLFRQAYNMEGDTLRLGEHDFSSKFKKNEGIHRSLNYYYDHYDMESDARKAFDKGICMVIDKSTSKAISLFDSALLVEDHPAIYQFKGSVLRTLFGKSNDAIQSFTKSIELDSTNWIAFSYRGEEYIKTGQANLAYADYSKVIDLKPRMKEGYKSRGNILTESGNLVAAYKDYSYALAIDSTDADLFYNRGCVSLALKQHFAAFTDFNRSIQKKPKDGDAYYMQSLCQISLGDSSNSIVSLDSASKLSKYNNNYHNELLARATEQNNQELMLKAHNRLVKYNRLTYKHLLNRGKYHLEHDNLNDAVEDLEKYVRYNKSSGEGHYFLSLAYDQTGNINGHEKHLKKSKKLGFNGD